MLKIFSSYLTKIRCSSCRVLIETLRRVCFLCVSSNNTTWKKKNKKQQMQVHISACALSRGWTSSTWSESVLARPHRRSLDIHWVVPSGGANKGAEEQAEQSTTVQNGFLSIECDAFKVLWSVRETQPRLRPTPSLLGRFIQPTADFPVDQKCKRRTKKKKNPPLWRDTKIRQHRSGNNV